MQNADDLGLIQEIEEDLQRQRFEALWKKYGNAIMGFALAIVLSTAGVTGWKSYSTNKQQQASAALIRIAEESKREGRIASYEAFVKEFDGTTAAVLARFFAAETAMNEGKKERAIAFYDALALDSDLEPSFRGLAEIRSILAQLDEGDPAKLEERLEPLMSGGAWQPLAYEIYGHLAVKAGDKEKAKKIFSELLSLKEITPGIQRRAADMFRWLTEGA